MITVVLAAAVFAGAMIQRLSGVGFALVSAPLLALTTTAYQSVRIANLLTVFVSLAVLASCFSKVDWHWARFLVPAGLLGVVPGIVLVRTLPSGPLQITIGGLVGAGLMTTVLVRNLRVCPTTARTAWAGLTSGFTNAAAGVGGPALTVFAVVTEWPQEVFAATAQLSFATQSTASVALEGLPHLSVARLTVVSIATACGLVAGHIGSRYIRGDHARRAAIVLAAVGAAGTVIKGFMS